MNTPARTFTRTRAAHKQKGLPISRIGGQRVAGDGELQESKSSGEGLELKGTGRREWDRAFRGTFSVRQSMPLARSLHRLKCPKASYLESRLLALADAHPRSLLLMLAATLVCASSPRANAFCHTLPQPRCRSFVPQVSGLSLRSTAVLFRVNTTGQTGDLKPAAFCMFDQGHRIIPYL
eukprot:6177513-Pleurochrysis_carterae.AAC.6